MRVPPAEKERAFYPNCPAPSTLFPRFFQVVDVDQDMLIEGPCRTVNAILEAFNCHDVASLAEQIDITRNFLIKDHLYVDMEIRNDRIFHAPRIGLSDKYPEFRGLKYRFTTLPTKLKKQKRSFEPVQ